MLAAIIIVAVFGLVNIKEAAFLWKANNLDFWLLIATFFSTLLMGIEYGIMIGVALSLIILIYRTSRPYVTELGKVYIVLLPALGITSEIISTHSRKPIFGYRAMIGSIMAIAFLSTIVWGHHMFISGMNPFLGSLRNDLLK